MNPLTSEVSTNEAARRVQVIPAPIVSPGNCGICGKHEHPNGFADARLDFEWYGTFYLCADCVGEFARAFGYIDEAQYQGLLDHISKMGEMIEWYENKFSKMESILGEQYVPIEFTSVPDVTSIVNVDAGSSEVESPNVTEESGGKPPTLQLVSEQGSDGVSGDPGIIDDADLLGL